MEINSTSCCGLKEIKELKDKTTPRAAMVRFLQDYRNEDRTDAMRWNQIPAFVIFSGVVRTTYSEDHYMHGAIETGYTEKFKKFIEDNKLGEVVETNEHPNRVNCPEHVLKIYIWHPSLAGLKRWVKDKKVRIPKKKQEDWW